MLAALAPALGQERPDAVLVYGDTNSTLAGALAAARAEIPVVHVEAGMRSFDHTMPEELNRVLTDHIGDLLLCASDTATANLRAESARGRIELVGDVMVDLALRLQQSVRANRSMLVTHHLASRGYLLLTAHRAGMAQQRAELDVTQRLGKAQPVAAGQLLRQPRFREAPAGARVDWEQHGPRQRLHELHERAQPRGVIDVAGAMGG